MLINKGCVVVKRNISAVPANCDVTSFKYFMGKTGCISPSPPHKHGDSVRVNVFEI